MPFPELRNARDIAFGREHTCVIRDDDNVLCWGSNRFGQIGDGTEDDRDTPTIVGLRGAVRIKAGAFQTCALLKDRSSYCWGGNVSPIPRKPNLNAVHGSPIVDFVVRAPEDD